MQIFPMDFIPPTITRPTIMATTTPTINSGNPHRVWNVSVIALACVEQPTPYDAIKVNRLKRIASHLYSCRIR